MTAKFKRALEPKVEIEHRKIGGDRYTDVPSSHNRREHVWYAGGMSPKDEYLERRRAETAAFKSAKLF